jgi:ubiquinone/menaquinone biosynthesis C-methylase UbiE
MIPSRRSTEFDPRAYVRSRFVTHGWHRDLRTLGLRRADVERKWILDVACGDLGRAVGEGPRVFGVDPNLGILRFFGDGKNYGGLRPLVPERSVRALAEQLPFQDGVFDFALSTDGVGWYPKNIHFEMALSEMLRVIKKPTGRVVFNIGGEMEPDIIDPVLVDLETKGFKLNVRGVICTISPPDGSVDT